MNADDQKDAGKVKALGAVKQLTADWLVYLSLVDMQIKMAKAKYDAARKHGFERLDALYVATHKVEH